MADFVYNTRLMASKAISTKVHVEWGHYNTLPNETGSTSTTEEGPAPVKEIPDNILVTGTEGTINDNDEFVHKLVEHVTNSLKGVDYPALSDPNYFHVLQVRPRRRRHRRSKKTSNGAPAEPGQENQTTRQPRETPYFVPERYTSHLQYILGEN